jgi:hypothetical protein
VSLANQTVGLIGISSISEPSDDGERSLFILDESSIKTSGNYKGLIF